MSRFPNLSETFILREMIELDLLGWEIELYPLIHQKLKVIHPEANHWIEKSHRFNLPELIFENIRLLFMRPRLYITLLLTIIVENIQSFKFLIRSVFLFPLAVWMAGKMKKSGVTHIHAHYATHPALVAWVIKKINGTRFGITVHAHDIFVDKCMLGVKLKDADYIVAISKYNKKFLVDLLGSWVGEKTYVIHCGIIPDNYCNENIETKIADDSFQIISIGSLQLYKGFSYLLDACKILKDKKFDFRCWIIGGGELFDDLKMSIAKFGLSDNVELLGPQTQGDIASILKKGNCYVQPSIITPSGKMEGIPVSIMEAMAATLPVVATNISGIPELVRDRETGILIPPEDAQAIAEAIFELYSNPHKAAEFSQNGKRLVQQEFEITHNSKQLAQLFEAML